MRLTRLIYSSRVARNNKYSVIQGLLLLQRTTRTNINYLRFILVIRRFKFLQGRNVEQQFNVYFIHSEINIRQFKVMIEDRRRLLRQMN